MPLSSGNQINPNLPNNGPASAGIVNRTNTVVTAAGQSASYIEVSLGSPAAFLAKDGITDGSVGPLDGIDFISGTTVGSAKQLRKGYAREITPGNPIYQLDVTQKAPTFSRELFMNGSGFKRLDDGRWFDPATDAIVGDYTLSTGYYQVSAGVGDRSIFGRGYGTRYVYRRAGSVTTEILDSQNQ